MTTEIEKIISGNSKEAGDALEIFLESNAKVFAFEDLNKGNKREELWKALFGLIARNETPQLHASCLAAIRILSREKTSLNELITEDRINLLLQHAHLIDAGANQNSEINYEVAMEALKCLCNIIYNSRVAAAICSKSKCIDGIMDRTQIEYRNPRLPIDLKIFDMRILFLTTALCSELRPKLKEELHGLKYLIEILENMIPNNEQNKNEHNSDLDGNTNPNLSDSQIDLMCEILKVLFNITVQTYKRDDIDEEEEAYYMHLVSVLRCLLISETQSPNKKLELHSNIVNLLTNMPNTCYNELVTPLKEDNISKELQYEDQNMEAVYQLFLFLNSRFENDVTVRNQQELLSPVLTVFLKGTKSSRIIRKYLRLKILPPLTDVHSRPEQGTTLRNHLCRMLTTPMTNVRDLTADLLFVLCKENVNRMIKYTGYGNAAGLFAQRGLLGGGVRASSESNYSSDSENSDTEEYREHKHGINPVMGCYELPHPSPFENMTEEQKEYEAMKLVNLMDDLTRKGIVKPCKIGEDGRPQPIEHVLQLQEDLPSQQIRRNISQDDSD